MHVDFFSVFLLGYQHLAVRFFHIYYKHAFLGVLIFFSFPTFFIVEFFNHAEEFFNQQKCA